MKKLLVLVLVALSVCVLSFSGCKKNAAKKNPLQVALIVEDTVVDKGWCQAMYDGIVSAQKKLPGKIECNYFEKVTAADCSSIIKEAVAAGFELIIAHGAQYKDTIEKVAKDYPDISFAFGTSDEVAGKNVFTYMPESEETGYLSGLLAGCLTKANHVGFVGPVDGGDAARYGRGFVMGVQATNPTCRIDSAFVGSFSDMDKSAVIATELIKKGCDVLTGASQQAMGALRATAKDPKALWLGQDLAQLTTVEGKAKCVAASSYAYDAVVIGMVEKIASGIKGGEVIPLSFSNGGFLFDWNYPLKAQVVTPDMETLVNDALVSFRAHEGTLANYKDVDLFNFL